MIKMPPGMTVDKIIDNFDVNKFDVKLPPFMRGEDFGKVLKGEAKVDSVTQDFIKGMNPGKFGPMSNPFAVAQEAGLSMDNVGNFLLKMTEGAPGNKDIAKAKALEAEGKFKEAADALREPLSKYPDALVQAYMAELDVKSGNKMKAVENIEKTLALAPSDDKLYVKAGQIFKEAGIIGPKVFVNGVKPDFDVKPFIEEGRTLVPFRALAETIGAQVEWNAESRKVTVLKDNKVVEMTLGSKLALVDGKQVTLEVPPQIVNGRTVVPLRFVGESLDADVNYDADTEIIKVSPK